MQTYLFLISPLQNLHILRHTNTKKYQEPFIKKGEVFPLLLNAITLTYIYSLFVHVDAILTHHIFSRACEHTKGKEIEITQTKEVVMNVYVYFKDVNGLKDLDLGCHKTFTYQHQEVTEGET